MNNFALQVTRDEFVYQDQLYIDVGNLKCHPRASIADLTSLLRPKLSKEKNKNNKAPKTDQVGHWYEAQCRHYGIPPTKDKNTAKIRLLDALNFGTLEVPARIKAIEADLKKEYAAVNRKAKAAAAKAAKCEEPVKDAAPSLSKKRKATDEPDATSASTPASAKKVNATKSVAKEKPKVVKKATEDKAKKPSKASSSKTPTAEEIAKAVLELQKKEKAEQKKAKKAYSTPKVNTNSEADNTHPMRNGRPVQTARRSNLFSGPQGGITNTMEDNDTQTNSAPARAIPRQTARRSCWTGPAGRVQNTIEFMPGRDEHDYGYDTEISAEPDYMDVDQALTEITGIYDITCPTIEEWSSTSHYNTSQLRLYICSAGSQTWASFDWGPWKGLMLMDPGPKVGAQVGVSFGWRTREHDTGEMRFGHSCTGEIDFDLTTNPIEVQGAFFGLYGQRVEFWGTRLPGPRSCGRSADQFKYDWDEFVREAY